MKKTKLWSIWAVLKPNEQQRMVAWLEMEQARDDVKRLYHLLLTAPETAATMEKTSLFTQLYGTETAYNDNWLRHAQSFLIGHIEGFLAYRSLRKKNERASPAPR